MAEDWIKVRVDLVDDPNVFVLSDLLMMDCRTVVGHLVSFWGWINKHTVTGTSIRLTDNAIDRRMGISGFSSAMRQIGWLSGVDMALEIPNYERHNSNTAKARSLESEAKRLRRATQDEEPQRSSPAPAKKQQGGDRDGSVGQVVGQLSDKKGAESPTREEKRREEILKPTTQGAASEKWACPPADYPIVLDGNTGERKYPMHALWHVGPLFSERCQGAQIDITKVTREVLQELTLDMRLYWQCRAGETRTQHQWEIALIKQMIQRKNKGQLYTPPGVGNGERPRTPYQAPLSPAAAIATRAIEEAISGGAGNYGESDRESAAH